MVPVNRVLCPIDFSDCSRHALDYAVALARQYGSTIAALLVVPPATPLIPGADLGPYPPYAMSAEDIGRLRKQLERFVLASAVHVPFTANVIEGSVVSWIVRRASELPADVIVMGTHGRSGFERLLLGSVTERVLLKASCPVLTVSPEAPVVLVSAGPVFRRIMCAVDFSPASMNALEAAASLARDSGVHLSVAHVLERVPIYEPVMMSGPGTPEHDRVAGDVARRRLHSGIPDAVRRTTQLTEVVAEGKAYREILRLASDMQAELIVIGAHGSGPGHHGFGSTTTQVVRHASCPVLTVRT
jgi:nucleotide-binding universal stress UspA family protein